MAEKKKRVRVDDETFVKAWMSAGSVREVAEDTGLSVNSCSVRSATLRKAGVDLPKFARLKREIAVDDLNKLIKSLKKK